MTTTPLLGITQVAPTQTGKETTINDGFSKLERSLNDMKSVSLASGNVELNFADYTSFMVLNATGAAVPGRTLTVPASKRLFVVKNSGSSTITVIPKATSGVTQDVPAGSFCVLFNDATDIIKVSDSAASGSVTAFVDLPDAPASYTGHGGEAIVVKMTEDGLEFGTIAVDFTDLGDVPSSFSGQGGKGVRVNAGATALEFYTIAGGGASAFTGLSDVPASYTSQGGKVLAVKVAENGVEFITLPEPVVRVSRACAITNADFEAGSLTGWTTDSGTNWHVGASHGAITSEGSYALLAYGVDTGDQVVSQIFDLTTIASTAELDDSPEIVVAVDTQTDTGVTDTGTIDLQFLTAADVVLDTISAGPYNNTGSWVRRTLRGIAPSGTRHVKVKLKAHDVDGSGVVFAYDNVDLTLRVIAPAITDFTELQDVPNSYTGQAHKIVRVNVGETALEFSNEVDTFLELTDTPSAFTSQANKLVGVKADESGLEFVTAPSAGATDFTDLGDVPTSYTGQTLKVVRVKADESGLEFATAGGGGASAIDDLTDVDTTTVAPTDGQALIWDNAGSKWVPGDVASGSGGGSSNVGAHKYWRMSRLYCNNSTHYQISMDNVEFRATAGGSSQTVTTATASTSFSGTAAANAVNGGAGVWAADGTEQQPWFKAYFATAVQVGQIAITARSSPADQTPVDFFLEFSDDDVTYTILAHLRTDTAYTGGSTQTFGVPLTVPGGGSGDTRTVPAAADYTLVGVTSGATLTDGSKAMILTSASTGNTATSMVSAVKNIPASTYSVKMEVRGWFDMKDFSSAGVCFYQSSSGKLVIAYTHENKFSSTSNALHGMIFRVDKSTAANGSGTNTQMALIYQTVPVAFYQLRDDGTKLYVDVSVDGGDNYINVWNDTYSNAGMTGAPDKIGFWGQAYNEDGTSRKTTVFCKDFTA
jgi:hypothetical protein